MNWVEQTFFWQLFVLKHYIAGIFILIGYYKLAQQKSSGWILTAIGSFLIVLIGAFAGQDDIEGIILYNFIFLIVSIVGYFKFERRGNAR